MAPLENPTLNNDNDYLYSSPELPNWDPDLILQKLIKCYPEDKNLAVVLAKIAYAATNLYDPSLKDKCRWYILEDSQNNQISVIMEYHGRKIRYFVFGDPNGIDSFFSKIGADLPETFTMVMQKSEDHKTRLQRIESLGYGLDEMEVYTRLLLNDEKYSVWKEHVRLSRTAEEYSIQVAASDHLPAIKELYKNHPDASFREERLPLRLHRVAIAQNGRVAALQGIIGGCLVPNHDYIAIVGDGVTAAQDKGKGLAQLTMAPLIDQVIFQFSKPVVITDVRNDNVPSLKSVAKIGFEPIIDFGWLNFTRKPS